MTDNLLSPDRPIEIAGQTYTLCGSLKALKGIQEAMDTEILQFLVLKLSTLSFDRLAKVISIAIEAGAAKSPDLATIETAIVDEIGIMNARSIVGEWLVLATTPKKDREKKALELASLLSQTR